MEPERDEGSHGKWNASERALRLSSPFVVAATPSPPHPFTLSPPAPSPKGVSLRASLIGMLLIPVTIYWITVTEVRWYTLDGTCLPLFIQPVFFLFLLCLVNLALQALARAGAGWSRGSCWSSTSCWRCLRLRRPRHAPEPVRGDGPRGQLRHSGEPVGRKVPPLSAGSGSSSTDKENVDAVLRRQRHIYEPPALLLPWVAPLFWWGSRLRPGARRDSLSINILLRPAWTEHEKLSFPLVQLPLAMTDPRPAAPFWTQPGDVDRVRDGAAASR